MPKILIIIGVLIVIMGIILWIFPNAFRWFGNLPGDINVRKENFSFHFPLVTMIIISIILTLLINFFRK